MRTSWRDGDRTREVELTPLGPGHYRVRVDEAEFEVRVEPQADGQLRLVSDTGTTVAQVTAAGARRFVRLGTLDFVLDRESAGRGRRSGAHGGGLEAPMPGVVTKVLVEPGDAVTEGQPLVALEAMKMEHVIRAPRDGRVKALAASVGQMVQAGAALVELED
jgi:3-methylcrotonyl-CoA carboxylase alpha subunit